MADDIRPATQVPRALAVLSSGGPTVAAAYLVNVSGDLYTMDTTGPADAYWVDDGSGGYEIDSGAGAHDAAFVKKVNDLFTVK